MEVNKDKFDFIGFQPKIMVAPDGKKQVQVKNYLQELKYKTLKYQQK